MNVDELISKLQQMDPDSPVLVEGAAETLWSVSEATSDDTATCAVIVLGKVFTVSG